MSGKLNMWTLYQGTTDFPGQIVARRFELDKPTEDHYANKDVEQVRAWIKQEGAKVSQGSLVCMPRQPQDDPTIIEVWL